MDDAPCPERLLLESIWEEAAGKSWPNRRRSLGEEGPLLAREKGSALGPKHSPDDLHSVGQVARNGGLDCLHLCSAARGLKVRGPTRQPNALSLATKICLLLA